MVLSTRASKVVRMGLYGLMVRFSTFLDAPRRALVLGLPSSPCNGGASGAHGDRADAAHSTAGIVPAVATVVTMSKMHFRRRFG